VGRIGILLAVLDLGDERARFPGPACRYSSSLAAIRFKIGTLLSANPAAAINQAGLNSEKENRFDG